MNVITWNVNGIRAVERKGELQKMLDKYLPDILFLQETKAHKEQLSTFLTEHNDFHQYYHSAEKKGYSGVSVWLRKSILEEHEVDTSMSNFQDTEGRILRLTIGKYIFFGVYFPNGGKSHEAWLGKIEFYQLFLEEVNTLKDQGYQIIWCGDLNVAHNEIDLARSKENQNSIGFLPQERSWVDECIHTDWIDVFRTLYEKKIMYTWWDMPTRARERNVGWRIDYFFVDKSLLNAVEDIFLLNEQFGSDHCPVLLKINISFKI